VSTSVSRTQGHLNLICRRANQNGEIHIRVPTILRSFFSKVESLRKEQGVHGYPLVTIDINCRWHSRVCGNRGDDPGRVGLWYYNFSDGRHLGQVLEERDQ
jgi:hypothetical protein